MAYNHQSYERPSTSCCEKIHEAIFGKSKRNDVTNPPSPSTDDSREVKKSEELVQSYSNNVEDHSFSGPVFGSVRRPKLQLIARPRVDTVGMNLKP
ncbi:hypothetical protein LXL04_018839 [Taraxacum kok-saghyz]